MQVNRVQDMYETAVKFFALPTMARYVIGTNFHLVKWEEFILNEDNISVMIFERAVEQKKYADFRQHIRNYRFLDGTNSK